MWNNISIFITISQGIIALIKWLLSFISGNKKGLREVYMEIEITHLRKKFRYLSRDGYNYKWMKGAKLLFILKDYFQKEEAKKFICACKQKGYISYDEDFDVNKKIIIRKEEQLVEKIISSCKSRFC